jgi:histidinol phosphatase-like enzyme
MPMKLVFDIDGTICTQPSSGDLEDAEPLKDRIAMVNKLKDNGATIVYFTSRGMKFEDEDGDNVDKKVKKLTKKQLEDWGAEYDFLIFGKPNADVYIDNKALNADDLFQGLAGESSN